MDLAANTRSELALPAPVLLVEDNPEMRERIRDILYQLGYLPQALIQAGSVAEALEHWDSQAIALALIDLGLPDGDGQQLVDRFHREDPYLPIVVVTTWSHEDAILSALEAGATGYVLKEREDVEVKLALRSVLQGGAPIDPFVAQRLLQAMARAKNAGPPDAGMQGVPAEDENKPVSEPAAALSRREIEILELVADGLSNREIAEQLFISHYTAACHIKHIYRKLAVSSRIQAVQAGRSQGLLP